MSRLGCVFLRNKRTLLVDSDSSSEDDYENEDVDDCHDEWILFILVSFITIKAYKQHDLIPRYFSFREMFQG